MLKSPPIKNGLLAGGAVVIYYLLFYFIQPKLLFEVWMPWSSLVIYILFMYKANMEVYAGQSQGGERSKYDEVIEGGLSSGSESGISFTLKQGIRSAFQVFIIATLMYTIFYYLLFNLFDPGLIEVQREAMIEHAELLATVLKDQAEQVKEQARGMDLNVYLKATVLNMAYSLIGGFVLSVFVAMVTRR